MVGGGQGRTPYLAPTIRPFLPADRLFSYLEAVLRTYNRQGRRDNIHKARIKVLVATLGAEEFARQVEEEFERAGGKADLPAAELERIRAAFAAPAFEALPVQAAAFEAAKADRAFARFARHNVHPHKAPGYAIVDISLKAPGDTPGDCTADQMDAIAELADRYSFGEIRVNYQQNLLLPHVKLDDVPAVFARLQEIGLATANIDLITDIIACPGLDYCALANARAIPIAQAIARRFADDDRAEEIGKLKINISGCINALRPPPPGQHRHPRRRQEGRGILPALARRLGRGGRQPGPDPRPRPLGGPGARRHRSHRRRLSARARAARAVPRHPAQGGAASVQGGRLCRRSLG